ncbi:MAG TPA: TonB-dependent receptor [Gammaproteobacteria bacterium]|nr:TonB-dependent receptor [Gammaproteobacteria bacterium]
MVSLRKAINVALSSVAGTAGMAALGTTAIGLASARPASAQQVAATAGVEEVTVTARRREEQAQDVPIALSVIGGAQLDDLGAFNANRVKELVPTLQLYSSNPRNTGVNIRGLGSPFGLTNDGIEPGVGFYIDGVLYARPASTALDFIDVDRVEVLRGPQGTLFGKNTTAGAVLVTTRKPSRTNEASFELGYGNDGFVQAKGSLNGPLGERSSGRLSFSGTQRDGTLYNVRANEQVNDINNVGVRGQLQFDVSGTTDIRVAIDWTRQRPNGYAQVFAGVVPTLRAENRQFEQIIADLHYQPVSRNPFDRLIDTDTAWRSDNDIGGASVDIDFKAGPGTVTSTTAWRYWHWAPSSDRDYLGLPVATLSQATSRQHQWSQEVRWTGDFSERLNGVFGFYAFSQVIQGDPVQLEQAGSAAYRFALVPSANASTPGLLDGLTSATYTTLDTESAAVFGQLDWSITDRLHFQPGVRFNYDRKKEDYERDVYGGLQTANAALIALQRSVYAPQAFKADVADDNTSGQLTLAYRANSKVNAYLTYATSYKSVGINNGGLPTDAAGNTILAAAEVKPEYVTNVEAGVKVSFRPGASANVAVFDTEIDDLQVQVNNAQFGVPRGYLANARKARSRGAEFDGTVSLGSHVSVRGALAYTDAIYVSFPDAPAPLEGTGGPAAVDASGGPLPGISKWAASFGAEFSGHHNFLGSPGELFGGFDISYRDGFSSSATPSLYLNIDGYSLANARVGFRSDNKWTAYFWVRNLTNRNYFEQLLAAPGGNGAGYYGAVLGDPRTYGLTVRYAF